MKRLGLDIAPHQADERRVARREVQGPDNPLRLVFVCAMWLTGFDAPSCSTVYLDKPMRNHTLMQTIARANRVFPGKHSGLIVDYANVFASLEQALAIYAVGQSGAHPVRDKQQLVEALRQAKTDAVAFCRQHGVSLEDVERTTVGSLERLKIIDAVECLISPTRSAKTSSPRAVGRTLFQAVKPIRLSWSFPAWPASRQLPSDSRANG